MALTESLYLGIDVGTGSARAGLFDGSGRMLGSGTELIKMWRPKADHVEQSSEDIWAAVCKATLEAMTSAAAQPDQVAGIGFDATCSLVALDEDDRPVSVSITGTDEQNVVVWMDHRAIDQAARINETKHEVLKYVGGEISPEMQPPKLLWLKENLPNQFGRTAHFLDLPDYLTYKATGVDVRSLCTTVCKWTYQGHEENGGWSDSFWKEIGLEDFVAESYQRIGTNIRPMGEAIGNGLTAEAAKDLGLKEGTPVGVGIIDAHAGGLGVIGAAVDDNEPTQESMAKRLALIGGTSSCHMAVSREPNFINGIWGPYYSAMVPGLWLTEGGQSATGALVDHIIATHSKALELTEEAKKNGITIYELLNGELSKMADERKCSHDELTADLHLLPYFHGNRSPRADPSLRGAIVGLRLDNSRENLALQYLAAIQGVAYGTKHIIDEMNAKGFDIDTILACGGGTKNPVFLQTHASITNCRIVLPEEPEAVLLGSAVLGSVAAGKHKTVLDAMAAMNRAGEVIQPDSQFQDYHHRKYRIFHKMYDDFMSYRSLMQANG